MKLVHAKNGKIEVDPDKKSAQKSNLYKKSNCNFAQCGIA